MTLLSRQTTVIFNPAAGVFDWDGILGRVADFWQERGWQVCIKATKGPGDATELARAAAAAEHGIVFAAGGDGTLNEVANGLVHTETVLAPMPVGTANSFAKELGLARPSLTNPRWWLHTTQELAQGRIQRMDVGKCTSGRYWLLWASTGIDGFVVRQIEPRPRWFKRLGPAGYLAKALYLLPRYSGVRAEIRVDNRTISGDYLLINVSNCRMFIGGELNLNRNAVLDDGVFEVWLFRGKNWPTLLAYSVEVSLENHIRDPNVEVIHGRYVAVHTRPAMPYHVDGEPDGAAPFACQLEPKALRMLVPHCCPVDLFSEPGMSLAGVAAPGRNTGAVTA